MKHYVYIDSKACDNITVSGNNLVVQIGQFLQSMPDKVSIKVCAISLSRHQITYPNTVKTYILKQFTPSINGHSVNNDVGSVMAICPLAVSAADDATNYDVYYTSVGDNPYTHHKGNYSTITIGFTDADGVSVSLTGVKYSILLEVTPYY